MIGQPVRLVRIHQHIEGGAIMAPEDLYEAVARGDLRGPGGRIESSCDLLLMDAIYAVADNECGGSRSAAIRKMIAEAVTNRARKARRAAATA
jgi:hypothetical protein